MKLVFHEADRHRGRELVASGGSGPSSTSPWCHPGIELKRSVLKFLCGRSSRANDMLFDFDFVHAAQCTFVAGGSSIAP